MDPGLHSEHGRRGGGAPLRRDRVPRHRRRQLTSGLLRLETHAAVVGSEKRKMSYEGKFCDGMITV